MKKFSEWATNPINLHSLYRSLQHVDDAPAAVQISDIRRCYKTFVLVDGFLGAAKERLSMIVACRCAVSSENVRHLEQYLSSLIKPSLECLLPMGWRVTNI